MTLRRIIAPSLLAGDFACLGAECDRLIQYGADWLHIDIMDGHFVPNLTIGPPVLRCIRKHCPKVFLDCHLMVSDPVHWVNDLAQAGATQITFHLEALPNPEASLPLITKIKEKGMRVGVAIKPDTPLTTLTQSTIINQVDMVLIMTVQPGFGGQLFDQQGLDRVRLLRSEFDQLDIQVDGGITMDNLGPVVEAGANIIVAGTLILANPDPHSVIQQMKSIMNQK